MFWSNLLLDDVDQSSDVESDVNNSSVEDMSNSVESSDDLDVSVDGDLWNSLDLKNVDLQVSNSSDDSSLSVVNSDS